MDWASCESVPLCKLSRETPKTLRRDTDFWCVGFRSVLRMMEKCRRVLLYSFSYWWDPGVTWSKLEETVSNPNFWCRIWCRFFFWFEKTLGGEENLCSTMQSLTGTDETVVATLKKLQRATVEQSIDAGGQVKEEVRERFFRAYTVFWMCRF